jgi:hypothetical protein
MGTRIFGNIQAHAEVLRRVRRIKTVTICNHKKCSQHVRRLLKTQRLYFFSVRKMENRIKFEIGLKQKAKKNFTLRTQRLFGVVRNVYSKINRLGSATCFPVYGTSRTLKDYEIKVEQQRAEAAEFLHRRLII